MSADYIAPHFGQMLLPYSTTVEDKDAVPGHSPMVLVLAVGGRGVKESKSK
jgi:hypothetical protein